MLHFHDEARIRLSHRISPGQPPTIRSSGVVPVEAVEWGARLFLPVSLSFLMIKLNESLLLVAWFFISFAVNSATMAEGSLDKRAEFFETKIRPILVQHCYECHSVDAKNVRGGLLLDSAAGLRDGGESGPVVDLNDIEGSLLISSLKHESFEMPPSEKLPEDVIRNFETWIADGAYDPRKGGQKLERREIDIAEGRKFWSFQPIIEPAVPTETDDWADSNIDRFIEAAYHRADVLPQADATPSEIVRRLSFALTGLPPTIQQIRDFEADYADNATVALERWADRWLDSPRFGERWGRHWLDVTRFSESSGGGRSLLFPHSWRFRDYVIRSFQNDKPLPQLIREHIAGDLLPSNSIAEKDEQIIGSGYLVLGPNNYEQQDKEQLRMDVIDEQISTIGRTFLGMTLGCVRCHDHKFDPIPITDYYAMAGIFRSTQTLTFGNVSGYVTAPLSSVPEAQTFKQWMDDLTALQASLASTEKKMKALGPALYRSQVSSKQLPGVVIDDSEAEFEGQWTSSTHQKTFVGAGYQHNDNKQRGHRVHFRAQLQDAGLYDVRFAYNSGVSRCSKLPIEIHHADGVTEVVIDQRPDPADGLFTSLGKFHFDSRSTAQVTVRPDSQDRGYVIVDAVQFLPVNDASGDVDQGRRKKEQEQLAAKQQDLKSKIAALKKNKPSEPIAMSVTDRKQPADWHRHIRGEIRNLGELVSRAALTVATPIDSTGQVQSLGIPTQASGRLQLSEWIASENNPLTRRVYVNRVWQHLIGEGLVRTVDNFGMTGQRPTHPKLLDYLAATFVSEDEWSTKSLIRRIVLSRVFRLSSVGGSEATQADPDNRLLARGFRRRIDAESLRDAMLAISGELDLSVTGGLTIQRITTYDNDYRHSKYPTMARSVFVPSFRNAPLPFLETFDGVNSNMVSGRRSESTLPSQALYLMNSDFVLKRSEATAASLFDCHSDDQRALIDDLYLSTLGRQPVAEEVRLVAQFLNQSPDQQKALAAVVQAVFSSIDFRYLD